MNLFLLAFVTGLLNGLVLWAHETLMREYYATQPVYNQAPHAPWY